VRQKINLTDFRMQQMDAWSHDLCLPMMRGFIKKQVVEIKPQEERQAGNPLRFL